MPRSEMMAFRVEGLDCAEEVSILKREIGPLVGGEQHIAFDVLTAKMTILPSARMVTADEIQAAVQKTGMRAAPFAVTVDRKTGFDLRTVLTWMSGALAGAAFSLHVFLAGGITAALGSEGLGVAESVPLLVRVLYLLAILAGVYFVLPKAWFALKSLRPDMNLLMAVAICGAILIGEWLEGATVAFLFSLSLTLESWSVGRARRAIEKLLDLSPITVQIQAIGDTTKQVAVESVIPGTIFLVKPGERLALDGEVTKGESEVNQAPITGESIAVPKAPGDPVFAGTVNGSGSLEVRSTKSSSDTTLANIVRMVGDAQQKRAPSEQWVDRFARVYTPAVMALAIAIVVIPVWGMGQPFDRWFYQALVLLVIACPCALVISTPVSVVAALAAAARNGVLVKGGLYMEMPARLKAIALDKTGTLTVGEPSVTEVVAKAGHTDIELLERAAAMEAHSDHPLAKAIVAYSESRGVKPAPAESFSIIPGKGASAQWNGRTFWLGSHRYLQERKQETQEVQAELDSLSSSGHTVVVIGNDSHVCGYFALADTIRPESRAAVEAIRGAGVHHVVMLTGDNEGTARAIAAQAGVTEYRAELLPADKVTSIEELVERYQTVGMIGDGINDAPALSRASLGIAMGAAGSDTAMEAADITLMSDDLSKVPWLIRHSRRMLGIIRANIVLSLAVKALFVFLTFAGHASLWAAIAADMGVSILVILNALRLLQIGRANDLIRQDLNEDVGLPPE